MQRLAARRGSVHAGLLAAGGLLVLVATCAAISARGRAFPSLLVDPFGRYSAVSRPGWGADHRGLRYPDLLVAVAGESLPEGSGRGGRVHDFERRVADRARRGETSIALTFATAAGPRELVLPLRRLDDGDLLLFFSLYVAAALLIAWSGQLVRLLVRDHPAGRAYVLWSASASVLFATFFDYHTTRWLVPFFTGAVVGFVLGMLWLAASFPTPLPRASWFRRGLTAVSAAGAVAALLLSVGWWSGRDLLALRSVVGQCLPLSAFVLLGVLFWRLRRADAQERMSLRWVLLGVASAPVLLGLGLLASLAIGSTVVHLIMPFLIPCLPLAIGASLVKHNLLGSTSVLTRRLFVVPVALAAVAGALVAWLAIRLATPSTGMLSILPTFISGGVFVALAVFGRRLVDRVLFSARSEFRPTLEQLSTELASLQHHAEVRDALRRVIVRWLPSARVDVLAPGELHRVEALPAGALTRLSAGDVVWTDESPWQRDLLLPMRSLGGLRGVLRVGPKHQGALYTAEDVSLLKTIASLGAVSMHNADALDDLEDLRRTEVDATRGERDQTLGIVSAEVAHEVSHPLQFIRTMLRRIARGQSADPEDVQAGQEEIQRLERLLGGLRRLQPPSLQRRPIHVRETVERALVFLREPLAERGLKVAVEVPADLVLSVDPDPLLQLFANLLRNAAQAAPAGGSVGVESRREGGELLLDVWDDGPGIPAAVADKLFRPWFTTRADGTGLGLRICQDIARRFEWTIESVREGPRTVFRLRVPGSQCVAPGNERPTPP